ncbi:MAG: hypothetical protein ACO3YN_13910 [Rubrivivax sp.]
MSPRTRSASPSGGAADHLPADGFDTADHLGLAADALKFRDDAVHHRLRAVRQVQERLQERAPELDIEFNEDGFQYWRRRHA